MMMRAASNPPVARTARELAARVLFRVAEQGAFASRALDAELSRSRFDPRDAALATEIVYGALRTLPRLDACYGAFLRSDPKTLDPATCAVLRAGTYQLLHLSRVPPHAVVDEAVSLVSALRGRKLAGLVNAVLRRVAAERPASPSPPTSLWVPDWVREEIEQSLGSQRAAHLLSARSLPPPLGVRVRAGEDRAELAQQLAHALPGAGIDHGQLSERCLLVRRGGDLRALPLYASGALTVQEEGSQWIASYLGAQRGERIADLCAGHGGKTTFLAEQVGDEGQVVAVDLDERKLDRIEPELVRLGMPRTRVETRAVDLSAGVGGLPATFDRVLLDAACTGLGTLQRRPDLLLRVGPADPRRLFTLQLAMLQRAAQLVRPGGVLLYSVCSLTIAEGRDVAAHFEQSTPGFVRDQPLGPQGLSPDADGVLRIGPFSADHRDARDSPDVYQVVRFRRVGP